MENVKRMMRYLNGDNASGDGKSVAQGWGAASVAVCVAVAYLNDLGHCATIEAVARASGQSLSPAGDRLRLLAGTDPHHPLEIRPPSCGGQHTARQKHFFVAV
jgi:hypothetical protein